MLKAFGTVDNNDLAGFLLKLGIHESRSSRCYIV